MPEETKPSYSPGLDGIIAGESSICWVDPNAGLLYRGYDAHELATKATFEDVAWLLLNGELPDIAQSEGFREKLAAESAPPEALLNLLRIIPKTARMMDVVRTGASLLGALDPDVGLLDHSANTRKAIRIIARLSTLVTTAYRVRQGLSPLNAGSNLSFAGRFLFSLGGREPQQWQSTALNTVLILYAEHEFNASTFCARVTASTLADMYSAIVSAIGTLEGPLHGGANEEAMKMLRDIGSPDRAQAWVLERLARREKIMGFGHRVYRTGDSRVPPMRQLLATLGEKTNQPQWLEICQKLDEIMAREKKLYANLDLYAAPVLHLLEIPAELNTPIFACARAAGWCAHVIEQQDHNRLIRPRSVYTGPPRREYQVRP